MPLSEAITPGVIFAQPVPRAPARFPILPFQSALSFVVILLLAAVLLSVDFLSRSPAVAAWFDQRARLHSQRLHEYYLPHDQFMDRVDYLWIKQLPQADYSAGGVSIFGSSVTSSCLHDLSAICPQAPIRDYGYLGANLTNTAHFIRFLIQRQNFLSAGSGKSLIIIGFNYADIAPPPRAPNYFKESVERSGLYQYDDSTGITALPLHPLVQAITAQMSRSRSFMLAVNRLLIPEGAAHPINPAQCRHITLLRLGDRWPTWLRDQMCDEASLLTDLKKQGANVVGVLLPEGSWNAGIPAHDQFMIQIRKVFAQQSVPLVDYTHLLPDSGFCDPYHCSTEGEPIIHQALQNIAADFLRRAASLTRAQRPSALPSYSPAISPVARAAL